MNGDLKKGVFNCEPYEMKPQFCGNGSIFQENNRRHSFDGNMILQFIHSADAIEEISFPSNCYTTITSMHSQPCSNNFNKVQRRNSVSSRSSLSEPRSVGPAYINRAYSGSVLQVSADEEVRTEPPQNTPRYEECKTDHSVNITAPCNNRFFKKHLSVILSSIYAVFIVTLGSVIYISDIIIGNTALAETFSIYLLIIGFVYILYLVIDIRMHVNRRKACASMLEEPTRRPQDADSSVSLPSWHTRLHETLSHHYCFNKGRHSGSFYLKLGAAGFCLGHLIHSGILLGYQIVFLTSEGDTFYECASVATLVLDITYPMYSFLLLYFIFKYSNVIINHRTELGRFALMHCISSNLCFWLWTILRETMDSLAHHSSHIYQSDSESKWLSRHFKKQLSWVPYSEEDARVFMEFFDPNATVSKCENKERMNVIYQNFSPYLYPFTVEYSILVVGILFIVWQNIGGCQNGEETTTKFCSTPGVLRETGFVSNLVIHVDCHSASTGLFAGILILVSSVVSIILFFIAISNPKYMRHGVIVNSATELMLLILMTISAILAYRKITKLDVNNHPVSFLDDLLLFLCIPAFFLNAIFSIVPAVQQMNGFSIANIVLQVIQMVIQTPLIIDGLRRCSNSRELRLEKPARGLVTFLVVCNVAMWIIETFEIKSHDLLDARYAFYGKVWWTIIGHTTVPLIMFYRFHSSVCLVDIWKSAYEPASCD